MKIVRTEYCRHGDTFVPVAFLAQTEIENAGYVPVLSEEPRLGPDGLKIWLFETTHESTRPRHAWLSELRAGCSSCLAPAEYHTGKAHAIGQNRESEGQAICARFRE
jgi:hypothetical protein